MRGIEELISMHWSRDLGDAENERFVEAVISSLRERPPGLVRGMRDRLMAKMLPRKRLGKLRLRKGRRKMAD